MLKSLPYVQEQNVLCKFAWYFFTVATVIIYFCYDFYPGHDLSQHVAMVVLLDLLFKGDEGLQEHFALDLLKPYTVGYLFPLLLYQFVSITTAIKQSLMIAHIATPLLLYRLLKVQGANPTIALLGFALFFGFPYHWGFFSYLLATPIGILVLILASSLSKQFDWRKFILFWLVSLILLFTHAVVFAVAMLGAVCILIIQSRPSLRLVYASTTALLLTPLIILAVHMLRRSYSAIRPFFTYNISFDKILTALESSIEVPGNAMIGTWGLVFCVLYLLASDHSKPRAFVSRSLPFLIPLAFALNIPPTAFGVGYIFERVGPFIVVLFLAAFNRPKYPSLRTAFLGIVVCIVSYSYYTNWRRIALYSDIMEPTIELMKHTPMRSRLIVLHPRIHRSTFPASPFNHIEAYHTAFRVGRPSYLMIGIGSPVQYTQKSGWKPEPWGRVKYYAFDGEKHTHFDYLLVLDPMRTGLVSKLEPQLKHLELVNSNRVGDLFIRRDDIG